MPLQSRADLTASINQVIQRVIQNQKQQAVAIDPAYERLWQILEGLMLSGGKRLRPYLTYLAYTTYNGPDNSDVYQVAAAQEFLHFALLIHDDIIDRDTIRYGRQNITGAYTAIYRQANQDALHYANGAALMAGDLALSQAYDLINRSSISADQKTNIINILSQSLFQVAGGELLDMEAVIPGIDHADYFTIARYKTASYSFVGPLLTGAVLAGSNKNVQKQLQELGSNLGIAYQLSDDLLGLYGSQETTGKPIISDLREGKKTYLFDLIQQLANTQDANYFSRVWGSPDVTIGDVERVRQIGETTTAKQQVEQKMEEYAHLARQSLAQLQLSDPHHQPFNQLIDSSTNRRY